jgi:uncharacterized protein (DUF2062 family)
MQPLCQPHKPRNVTFAQRLASRPQRTISASSRTSATSRDTAPHAVLLQRTRAPLEEPKLARFHRDRKSLLVSPPTLFAPAAPARPRSFWHRRIRDPIVAQLTQGITPHKIALTIAVGSAIALFPILGTTTLLCFLVALVLKLNQPIIQLINQACWPIHLPAIYVCVRFGGRLFGTSHIDLNFHHMSHLLWNEPVRFAHEFGTAGLHAVVAWCLIAPFYIAAVYYCALPLTRSITRAKADAIASAPPPADHPIP